MRRTYAVEGPLAASRRPRLIREFSCSSLPSLSRQTHTNFWIRRRFLRSQPPAPPSRRYLARRWDGPGFLRLRSSAPAYAGPPVTRRWFPPARLLPASTLPPPPRPRPAPAPRHSPADDRPPPAETAQKPPASLPPQSPPRC